MAFSLLGAMNGLAQLMPGYVNGYRTAIDDNWKDIANYNAGMAGQLKNLYNEAIFNPSVMSAYDRAAGSRLNLFNLGMQTAENIAGFPGRLEQAELSNTYRPGLYEAQSLLTQSVLQQMRDNPTAYMSGGYAGLNPYTLFYGMYPWLQQPGATP